jgi:enterochelin esterase family protein
LLDITVPSGIQRPFVQATAACAPKPGAGDAVADRQGRTSSPNLSSFDSREVGMRHGAIVIVSGLLVAGPALAQDGAVLDPHTLEVALAAKPQGAEADRLAERVRQAFGGREALLRGGPPMIDELAVAWAIELPGWTPTPARPSPRVWRPVGNTNYPMTRVGNTDVYALVRSFAHGDAFAWTYDAGVALRSGGGTVEVYETHRDARVRPDVPKGTLRQMPQWRSSIFPGTTRDWWVYVPAQYRPGTPAAVMVFQDGNAAREYVVPVFDNLIAQGDMPVTVGIFIEPGGIKAPRDNRSFEYDTLGDRYARFLLDEILPEVEKSVALRRDAAARAIAGQSSGAIVAFTVAWERPNEFSKVLSGIGSFTNIAGGATLREGGHNYAALVRAVPRKPIRIFMQDGENDLDNQWGNWWLANLTMARSLAYAGYDYTFVQGKGFHTNSHLRAILPDALRWLWRDWRAEVPAT